MNTVAEYINRVKALCDMEAARATPSFFIAGPVNSGKSTLVNSLLGQRICPDDASPSTLFPVYFGYSDTPSAWKTVRGRSTQLPDRELRELLRNRKRNFIPERADVFLPCGFLQWCSLVDTPGIGLSAGVDGRIRDCLTGADGIVFIFHQRGIEAETHRFLTELAAAGVKGWISFWVNANVGLIDGTSLAETSQALRTIFPGRSEVYAINTRDPASTGLISLYLQVKALESSARAIEARLSKRDRLIPSLVERASIMEDDERFLLKFWEVFEEAELVNSGRQAVRDLPLIHGNLISMLRAGTERLTAESSTAPALKKTTRAGTGLREKIGSLIREMQSDKDLARYGDRILIKNAALRLGEKYRVMVAGPFSTGKTTFLNALLGETLLPAEDRATTSCVVRAGYGLEKSATVEYLFRAEFYPVCSRGGKSIPDRQEIIAITSILDNPPLRELVGECQVCRNGMYKSVSLSQLREILDELYRPFFGGEGSGKPEKPSRVPLFSHRAAPGLPPGITAVRFTLGGPDRLVFPLDDDRQRLAFYRSISPPGSFLVDSVTISYPSPILALADFIDTPGMDSLHKRHQERAAGVLATGDLALIFLHAKHVLAGGVPDQITPVRSLAANIPVIYVINFADTVSETDREKVSLYVRQKMGRETGSKEILPYPQVYAISALNALHRGDEGFDRLMRRVRKKIEDIEARKIAGMVGEISSWLEQIAAGNTPEYARQAARRHLGELERIQKIFFNERGD